MKTNCRTLIFAIVQVMIAAGESISQALGELQLHGYGAWGYGRTNGNNYLLGNKHGNYDNVSFAMVMAFKGNEHLRINASVELLRGHGGSEGEPEIEIDFAFAEWQFSNACKFRIGQVKHPFGIHAETYDVGTLRPFFTLPQAIYGPAGIVAESYRGAGLTGLLFMEKSWNIEYDAYGGEIELVAGDTHGVELPYGETNSADQVEHVRDFIGGRLTFITPVNGLNFGLSAYSGGVESDSTAHFVLGAHVEYLSDKWSLHGEFARHAERNKQKTGAFYIEAAYTCAEKFQTACRFEWLKTEHIEQASMIGSSLLEHREYAIGINYWFDQRFVVKLSFHRISGNRFARPEIDIGEPLEERTNLFILGSQFAF